MIYYETQFKYIFFPHLRRTIISIYYFINKRTRARKSSSFYWQYYDAGIMYLTIE